MKHFRRMIVAVVAATTVLFIVGTPALAASPAPPVDVDTTNVSTVVVAAPIVTLIVSALIPLLTGLLTKATWSPWIKMTIMLVLNAISAFVTSSMLADGSAVFSSEAIWTWVVGTIVSAVAYVIAYKPNGITSNTGGKLATVGIK